MSTHETILNAMAFSRCASALQQRRSISATAAFAHSCSLSECIDRIIGNKAASVFQTTWKRMEPVGDTDAKQLSRH